MTKYGPATIATLLGTHFVTPLTLMQPFDINDKTNTKINNLPFFINGKTTQQSFYYSMTCQL